ncbi:MAG: PP2C family protein-serine/threonine phosphatase [Planctomycetaceae bacterium]|jgi:sigma-B regulation protein RsbU (phosphoserine phosphatase)
MSESTPVASRAIPKNPVVLLVDDQRIVGEAVRQMLSKHPDIEFHYCQNPLEALDQAAQLQPTVILQDLVMPEVDGLTLVKFMRASRATRDIPVVVLTSNSDPATISQALGGGAHDYLVKMPSELELVARIRNHTRGYLNLLERNQAFAELAASQQRLSAEMDAGAKYVASLLPKPIKTPLHVDWRFVPSAELGGDSLDYFTLDDGRVVLYMLDVTGHGLASALLGVTVSNLLRARALPGADFGNPAQVLTLLNKSFQMEQHGGRFFTMWYGVLDLNTRHIVWCGAGHPPTLLFPGGQAPATTLDSTNPGIGMFEFDDFEQQEMTLPEKSRLFIYSDGAFEIHKRDGGEWTHEEFMSFLSQGDVPGQHIMDRLIKHCRELKGADILDDDFSIMEVTLG